MTDRSFYTDRTKGPTPRLSEHIPEAAWLAIAALVESRIDDNWLAKEFPDLCIDGNGISGTNHRRLSGTLNALIPELGWPLHQNSVPDTETVLDLLDFVGQRVALPVEESWHSYFRHHELSFDVRKGQDDFRADVEQIFARMGIAYQINQDMIVCRLGPPEAREAIADLDPDSGDATLDDLIRDARRRFLSRQPQEASVALEKLWDGFERLKTLEPGRDKKACTEALLDRAGAGAWREALDRETRELTNIGNNMQIRHFETTKERIPDDAVDYLFTRLAALMLYLLRATDRLA
ncbi:MAG: hypothetical protein ACRDRI_01615 [Pseudonocardiaceae bacterium]